jgi:hypothetical protein
MSTKAKNSQLQVWQQQNPGNEGELKKQNMFYQNIVIKKERFECKINIVQPSGIKFV